MLAAVFYGPGDWLVKKFNSRFRRAFGFWVIIFAAIGTPIAALLGQFALVIWLAIISVLALIPNFTSETPTEEEVKE